MNFNIRLQNPFYVDLRSLALIRILLGFLLLSDLIIRGGDFFIWTTDDGVMPRHWLIDWNSPWRWSLYFISGHWTWSALLFSASAFSALMVIVGFKTRFFSVLSLVLLISLQNRTPLLMQGGDSLLSAVLFWACFLPMGARYSLESVKNSLDPIKDHCKGLVNNHLSISSGAILIQAMSVYFFSAFLKTGAEWQLDGSAIYFALHLDDMTTGLAQYWRDYFWLTKPLTHYVWWLELLGPLLIFTPIANTLFRYVFIACFITLEIGFLLNLQIGLFPLISITSILFFLPNHFWDLAEKKVVIEKQKKLIIYFDQPCGFCRNLCLILRAGLFIPHAKILPAQSIPEVAKLLEEEFSWVVETEDGRRTTKTEAMETLFRRSPVFWPAAPAIRLLNKLGDKAYRFIGEHREEIGARFETVLPIDRQYQLPGKISECSAAIILLTVILWNISTIPDWRKSFSSSGEETAPLKIPFPSSLSPFLRTVRLDQTWNMFAPYPTRADRWLVVPALTSDDNLVYLSTGSPAMTETKETELKNIQVFENYRWRKYLHNLGLARFEKFRRYYGDWLCRTWRDEEQPELRLQGLHIYQKRQKTHQPGEQPLPVTAKRIWRHWCDKDKADSIDKQIDLKLGIATN